MAIAAGCGGGSLGASTAPVPAGTQVSPQRYLADSAAAAEAVSAFSAVLAEVAPEPRRRTLLAVAPRLDAALARAATIAASIDAQHLEDRRLEAQRARATDALDEVVATMKRVAAAATAGDPVATAAAAADYAKSVGDLRSQPTSTR